MDISYLRGLVQGILPYYLLCGVVITLIGVSLNGIKFLIAQWQKNKLRDVFLFLGKCFAFVLVGFISELALPGSSFVFIVTGGVPIAFICVILAVGIIMTPAFVIPLLIIKLICEVMIYVGYPVSQSLASFCKRNRLFGLV